MTESKRRRSMLITITVNAGRDSKPPQQALDVIELDHWAGTITGATAQLVEDLARFLQDAGVRDLHVALVEEVVTRQRTAERVAIAHARIFLAVAVGVVTLRLPAVLHLVAELLGKFPRALLQLIERIALRTDRRAGVAPLQRAGRVAHRPLGAAERVRDIARARAEVAHDLAKRAPQVLLLASSGTEVAKLRAGIIAGLLPILVGPAVHLALGTKAAVEKLLLTLHHVLQPAHHLSGLIGPALLRVAGAGHAQILQHVLELR